MNLRDLKNRKTNPNIYKISLVYKQRKNYFNLTLLNLILVVLVYAMSLTVMRYAILNTMIWGITIGVGIYVLIKFNECRYITGKLLSEEVNKNKDNKNWKEIKISKWTDWKLYTVVIVNILISSHSLALVL